MVVELAGIGAVVALLVAINGIYVAAEFALVGVRPTRLAQLASQGNLVAKRLEQTLTNLDLQGRYFATTQLGITAASLALGMYGEVKLAGLIEPALASLGGWAEGAAHTIAFVVAVSVLTFLHVVLGEMVPKSVALRYPETTAFGLAPLMRLSLALVRPVVATLSAVGRLVMRLLRIRQTEIHGRILSPEEIAIVIGESADGGLIEQREQQIMLNIFDFGEREVHQVMTPRTRMVAIPVDVEMADLEELLSSSSHTRFPVYDCDLDHVMGTLHLKDFIRWRIAPEGAFDLSRLVRPARMVPEHMPARQLLETFRTERSHMAVVIDEYGGTAGLVTLEDVAEELVGEMLDEFDVEAPALTVIGPGLLDVRGDLQLDDLADYVFFPEDRPDVDTVGGLLVTLLGRPAEEGDEAKLGAVTLTATKVNELAVEVVRVAGGGLEGDPPAE